MEDNELNNHLCKKNMDQHKFETNNTERNITETTNQNSTMHKLTNIISSPFNLKYIVTKNNKHRRKIYLKLGKAILKYPIYLPHSL